MNRKFIFQVEVNFGLSRADSLSFLSYIIETGFLNGARDTQDVKERWPKIKTKGSLRIKKKRMKK